MITTNDLKKGNRVQLQNGWYATLCDNRKGNVRVATVEGLVTETGSIYSHDIVSAQFGNDWVLIQKTSEQLSFRKHMDHYII